MRCILIDAHLSDGDQLVMLDVLEIDLFKVSTRVCVSTHSLIMYVLYSYRCHLSDGDRLVMLDVLEIDLFKVSTRVCVSTLSDNVCIVFL